MDKLKTSTKRARSSGTILKRSKTTAPPLKEYFPTAQLADKEFISQVVMECLIDNDVEGAMDAIRSFIDAQNKLQMSKTQKMARSTIYDALRPGANPTMKTLAKLLHATVVH